jgi:hypothetical protein
MLGVSTAHAEPAKQVRLVRASVHVAGVVKHLADRNAATE